MTKEKDKKTAAVRVRMTPTELERFKSKAGGNLAGWMRRSCMDAAIKNGPHLHADMLALCQLLEATNSELVAHGRNLNQIAKRVNSGGNASGLQGVLDDIQSVRMTAMDAALHVTKTMRRVR